MVAKAYAEERGRHVVVVNDMARQVQGVDLIIKDKRTEVKTDRMIALTSNIYWEVICPLRKDEQAKLYNVTAGSTSSSSLSPAMAFLGGLCVFNDCKN